MIPGRRRMAGLVAASGLAALAACNTSMPPISDAKAPVEAKAISAGPVSRAPVGAARATAPLQPSAQSRELAAYYARVQADLLVRGLLRTDGGGPDTPFTDTMLIRDFQKIALEDEFVRGEGLRPSAGGTTAIKKWTKPIRVAVEFGPRSPRSQVTGDRQALTSYVARLARITGHPISMTRAEANFHVFFVSQDDTQFLTDRVRALVPDIGNSAIGLLERLPRGVHCLVFAFSNTREGYDYAQAIAVIRSEHPDLLRLSCIHEEVAQGLGLGNDDPRARPSIFNDDDEFALLTTHDELLLKILYDPRLRPGMTADEAMPIVRERATALMAGDGPG